MSSSQIAGFGASVLIGVSLGLIGGGGSILTLPVLVYLLHINPILSTAYSLFIVGSTSLIGSINYIRRNLVNYSVALSFALPSFITVIIARRLLLPQIPESIQLTSTTHLSKEVVLMLVFALIMLVAAFAMIREHNGDSNSEPEKRVSYTLVSLDGALVGIVTGLLGAGGGFLIIPALVIFARLPMKQAVGTSLLIIAINSLIGFASGLGHYVIDWAFLLKFTTLAVIGISIGTWATRYIAGATLKRAFGWFVLLLSLYIMSHELFFSA